MLPEAAAVEVELPHVFFPKFDLSHWLGFSRIPLTALPPAGERAWSSGISCCQGHYSQPRGGGGPQPGEAALGAARLRLPAPWSAGSPSGTPLPFQIARPGAAGKAEGGDLASGGPGERIRMSFKQLGGFGLRRWGPGGIAGMDREERLQEREKPGPEPQDGCRPATPGRVRAATSPRSTNGAVCRFRTRMARGYPPAGVPPPCCSWDEKQRAASPAGPL